VRMCVCVCLCSSARAYVCVWVYMVGVRLPVSSCMCVPLANSHDLTDQREMGPLQLVTVISLMRDNDNDNDNDNSLFTRAMD
jgi:hypothetical protein